MLEPYLVKLFGDFLSLFPQGLMKSMGVEIGAVYQNIG